MRRWGWEGKKVKWKKLPLRRRNQHNTLQGGERDRRARRKVVHGKIEHDHIRRQRFRSAIVDAAVAAAAAQGHGDAVAVGKLDAGRKVARTRRVRRRRRIEECVVRPEDRRVAFIADREDKRGGALVSHSQGKETGVRRDSKAQGFPTVLTAGC